MTARDAFWSRIDRAARDPAAMAELESELGRPAGVLVADISGFLHICRHRGIVGALAVTRAVDRAAMPALAEHGATVVKRSGDALLAVLADGEAALLAALDVARAVARLTGPAGDVGLSIGLCAGPVLAVPGEDAWGHPVNDAFRLAGAGERGEILASPTIIDAMHLPQGVGAWRAPEDRVAAAGLPFVVVRDYTE